MKKKQRTTLQELLVRGEREAHQTHLHRLRRAVQEKQAGVAPRRRLPDAIHEVRLLRRRQRHPRLHHRRHRRSLLPRDPRGDRKGDVVPPPRDLAGDITGDGEGLGVFAEGECGVKVLWIRLGGGKGKSCRKNCFQKSRKCVFLQPQKFLERCINTWLKNLGNVIYETEDLRQISPVEA